MQQDPEDETLPTVLVYRGGELETTWVRFDLELEGGGFDARDAREQVERILLKCVLSFHLPRTSRVSVSTDDDVMLRRSIVS